MPNTARAYFDTFFSLAGEPGQKARDLAGRIRSDVRAGAERFRTDLHSGTEQVRSHGSRTITDVGRLVRAEIDAGLSRIGLATQTDLDDLNLRLEHGEEEIRELRSRLAEAEARASRMSAEAARAPGAATDEPNDEEQA